MAKSFNLQPAPKVENYSEPVDLGDFDPRYAGWIIVFKLDAPMSMNDYIAVATDNNASVKERNEALDMWTRAVAEAWNFVDDEGNPIPQPSEGGFAKVPQALLAPISEAFAREMQPKKAS